MSDFFALFDQGLRVRPHLCLEVGYSRITDWMVHVYDKTGKEGWGDPIFSTQSCDKRLAFAEATTKLAEYLSETCGGY